MTLITCAAGLGCERTAILSTSSAPAAGKIVLAFVAADGAALPGDAKQAASTIVAAAMAPVRRIIRIVNDPADHATDQRLVSTPPKSEAVSRAMP